MGSRDTYQRGKRRSVTTAVQPHRHLMCPLEGVNSPGPWRAGFRTYTPEGDRVEWPQRATGCNGPEGQGDPRGCEAPYNGCGALTKSQALVARTRSSGDVRQLATLNTINPQHLPVPATNQTPTPICPKLAPSPFVTLSPTEGGVKNQ